MPSETADKILRVLMEKTRDAAVAVRRSSVTMIKYANSQPSIVQNWLNTTVNIYLNREGRVYVTTLETANLGDAVQQALNMTEHYKMIEPSIYNAELPEPIKRKMESMVYDPKIEETLNMPDQLAKIPYEYMGEYGIERFAGMIELGVTEEALKTSKGFEGTRKTSYMKGYIRGFRGENSGQWAFTTTEYNEEIVKEAVVKAYEYASLELPRMKIEPGEMTVILSPMVHSNLVNFIADSASAMHIDMGLSFLAKHRIGEKIAAETYSLYDAPLDTDMPYTTTFDDEGVPTRDKAIISRGELKSILYNTKTAAKKGEKTTGNAGWVSPHPWNLRIEPGDASIEEMISQVKKGVLITNNWYTRLQNYIEGEFSTVSRDAVVVIRNGEPVGLTHRIRLADRFPRLLRSVALVGKKVYQIQWWEVETPVKSPYIMIEKANITIPE